MALLGREPRAVFALVVALAGLAVGFPFIEFALSYLLSEVTGIDSTPRFLVPADLAPGEWAWHAGVVRLLAGLVAIGLLFPWGRVDQLRRSIFVGALAPAILCCVSGIAMLAFAADFGCLFNPDAPWDCSRD